ncbi:MAG TPA: four helix bundle protein [Phycisphaerae bacterium]|nr:four helix bundle protein [Phycisphaerae bacterium]
MPKTEFEFEKLLLYQEARAFRCRIFKLSRLLPKSEFKLAGQMRDAGRSLTNCIAEGHGRYTFRDRVHFCRQSRGSLCELVDDINICSDEGYAKPEHLETLRDDAAKLLKRLNSYMKYLTVEGKKLAALNRRPQPTKTIRQLPITNY